MADFDLHCRSRRKETLIHAGFGVRNGEFEKVLLTELKLNSTTAINQRLKLARASSPLPSPPEEERESRCMRLPLVEGKRSLVDSILQLRSEFTAPRRTKAEGA